MYLGGFRAYKCSEVSSHGSKWKADLLKKETEARGEQTLSSKGILKNDITYAHANAGSMCNEADEHAKSATLAKPRKNL